MKEENKKSSRKLIKGVIFALACACVIGIVVDEMIYQIIVSQNEVALNSYSEETYQYLNKIAEKTIAVGEGIDILEILNYEDPEKEDAPKVIRCEILYVGEDIILEYSLDNNEGINFAYQASMQIKLSKELKVMSRKPNFSSEEEYIEAVKQNIREGSHEMSSCVFSVCSVFIGFILIFL